MSEESEFKQPQIRPLPVTPTRKRKLVAQQTGNDALGGRSTRARKGLFHIAASQLARIPLPGEYAHESGKRGRNMSTVGIPAAKRHQLDKQPKKSCIVICRSAARGLRAVNCLIDPSKYTINSMSDLGDLCTPHKRIYQANMVLFDEEMCACPSLAYASSRICTTCHRLDAQGTIFWGFCDRTTSTKYKGTRVCIDEFAFFRRGGCPYNSSYGTPKMKLATDSNGLDSEASNLEIGVGKNTVATTKQCTDTFEAKENACRQHGANSASADGSSAVTKPMGRAKGLKRELSLTDSMRSVCLNSTSRRKYIR